MRDMAALRAPKGRRGLASRLLLLILAFSSVVTLLSTAAQLYMDYHRDVVAIEGRLDEIGRGSLDSMAVSLWNVDTGHLGLQLEGLLRLPDMQALEVREAEGGSAPPIVMTVGRPAAGKATISRTMPLTRDDGKGGRRQIGTLVATATLDGVYGRLLDRVAVILASQFIKTVIVSAFIFYIVHMVVTRHITAIAGHFRSMGTAAEAPPLALARPKRHDELDDLVESFNALTTDLHRSYAQVARTSASLDAASALAAARAVKLEETNGELRRLAQVTAHHLQEPLRPMAINAQRLARLYGPAEPEPAGWCASIVDGTVHLGALLRDFQRYVAALTEEPRLAPCDMGVVAGRVRARALEDCPQAIVHLGPLPWLMADERMMAQVFHELLDNALRHARPGGIPEVAVSATRLGGDEWEFTVADNGPGFDAAAAGKVFDVFEVSHGRAPDHTGLGLPMCKAILRAHRGHIAIVPSPAGGMVRFTLPGGNAAKSAT